MRRDAFALLLLGAASIGSYHWTTVKPMTPPFRFHVAPLAQRVSGSEVWDATLVQEGLVDDSIPTGFLLSLASPARSARAGSRIHATLRRGDRRSMKFFFGALTDTFEPPGFRSRGSGALIPFQISPADSVQLTLTVRARESHEPWMALAELRNGGRFLLAIDSAAGWGEFRSVGDEYHMQVLTAIAGLAARQ